MDDFIPDNFDVPEGFITEHFKSRMLTIHDVVKDYDAVITSITHLKGVFGPNADWPSENLTLEQNLIDLGWHQKEFQRKTSFAYTVMSPNEKRCLGCFYIYKSKDLNYDAVIYMWVRQSSYEEGLDPILEKVVKDWINEKWPFKKVLYFGRC